MLLVFCIASHKPLFAFGPIALLILSECCERFQLALIWSWARIVDLLQSWTCIFLFLGRFSAVVTLFAGKSNRAKVAIDSVLVLHPYIWVFWVAGQQNLFHLGPASFDYTFDVIRDLRTKSSISTPVPMPSTSLFATARSVLIVTITSFLIESFHVVEYLLFVLRPTTFDNFFRV